jgi:hypothetical protein
MLLQLWPSRHLNPSRHLKRPQAREDHVCVILSCVCAAGLLSRARPSGKHRASLLFSSPPHPSLWVLSAGPRLLSGRTMKMIWSSSSFSSEYSYWMLIHCASSDLFFFACWLWYAIYTRSYAQFDLRSTSTKLATSWWVVTTSPMDWGWWCVLRPRTLVTKLLDRWGRGTGTWYVVRYLKKFNTMGTRLFPRSRRFRNKGRGHIPHSRIISLGHHPISGVVPISARVTAPPQRWLNRGWLGCLYGLWEKQGRDDVGCRCRDLGGSWIDKDHLPPVDKTSPLWESSRADPVLKAPTWVGFGEGINQGKPSPTNAERLPRTHNSSQRN